ncbi:hypothetical protein HY994_02115 [Candidatus Micrarchaeota archaeon]|nr:hypothetical protein [Candidatus Micrarchaeota archaeon]
MQLDVHLGGLRGVLTCAQYATSPQAIKTAWDEISSADSSTLKLNCAQPNKLQPFEGACVAGASRLPVLRYGEVEKPNCYNPTLAALLQIYREKIPVSDALLEERVQNNLYFAATQRARLGEAYLDLARTKYRYASQKDLKEYADEQLLSNEDRKGIHILAQCVQQKVPLKLFIAYAEAGEFPPEMYLRRLKCVSDNPSATLVELQANWAAMGHAIVGHNILLRSPYASTPSRVYDIVRATDTHLAQEAADSIIATDLFVNTHLPGLREGQKNRISFKGATGLSLEMRLVLADVLEKKFLKENAGRIQKVKDLKAYAAGLDSCALGEVFGAGFGAVATPVLRAAGNLPGGWKAVGVVATLSLTAWGTIQTISSTTRLISSYKTIPLNEKVSEICGLVSQAIQTAPDAAEMLKALKAKGAKIKIDKADVVPTTPIEKIALDQEQTPTRTSANQQIEDINTPDGLTKKSGEWVDNNPDNFNPAIQGDRPPSPASRKKAQKTLEESGADLTTTVVEQEKPKLDELHANTKSTDTKIRKAAESDLAVQERLANTRALDAATDGQNAHMSSQSGEPIVVYVPKDKSGYSLKENIVKRFTAFFDATKNKLKTLVSPKTTPDGTVVFTPSDFAKAIRKAEHSSERMSLLRQAMGTPDVRASTKKLAVLRKTVVGEFKNTLNEKEKRTFDELMSRLYNPETMEEIPGGFQKAREYYRDKIHVDDTASMDFMKNYPYDELFAKTFLLSVDPELKRFDVSGQDNALLRSVVDFNQGDNFAYSMVSSRALRDAADTGKPVLSAVEIDHLYNLGNDFNPNSKLNSRATLKQRTTEFSDQLPSIYSKTFEAAARDQDVAHTLGQTKATRLDKKGEGGFRTAYLEQPAFEDSTAPVNILAKVGETDKMEAELLARNSKYGVAPKPYGHLDRVDEKGNPLKDSVFYQEYIDGELLADVLKKATLTEKQRILAELGEMDAIFVTHGAVVDTDGKILMPFVQDGDSGNIIIRKKPKVGVENTGRAVQIDLDPKLISLREPNRWLYYQLLLRSLDFPSQDLTPYLSKLHSGFKRTLGDQTGDHVFKEMLADVQRHLGDPNAKDIDLTDFTYFKNGKGEPVKDALTGRGNFFAVIHDFLAGVYNQKYTGDSVRSSALAGVSKYAAEIGVTPSKDSGFDFKNALSGKVHCTILQYLANAC